MLVRAYLDLLVKAQVLVAEHGLFPNDSKAAFCSGSVVSTLPLLHGTTFAIAVRQTLQLVHVTPEIKQFATAVVFAPFAATALSLMNNLEYFQAAERQFQSGTPEVPASTRHRVR